MSSSSSCLWLLSTESSLQSWTFPTPSTPLPPFPQALTLLALDMGGPLSMSITQVKCAVILLDMDQRGCINWNCREGKGQSSNKIFIIVLGSIIVIGFLRTREDLCWKYHSRLTFSGDKLIFKYPISCHLFLKDGLKYLPGMHPLHQAARPRGSLKLNF